MFIPNKAWLFGTHAALGGSPWNGDMPPGHSWENDKLKAVESDVMMRQAAPNADVPINVVDDYGYDNVAEPNQELSGPAAWWQTWNSSRLIVPDRRVAMREARLTALLLIVVITRAASAADADEVDGVLRAFGGGTWAIGWIDVNAFDGTDSVPCPGGLMDFNAPSPLAESPWDRMFRDRMDLLKRFGVTRIWFEFNHIAQFDPPRVAVLPCKDPANLFREIEHAFDEVAKHVEIEGNFVVVRFQNKSKTSDEPDSWAEIRPLLAKHDNSHGYIHRGIEYVVLAMPKRGRWLNPFFNTEPELAKLAQEHLPHAKYVSFIKQYPARAYRTTFHFEAVEARDAARNAAVEFLGAKEAEGIKVISEQMQLIFAAENKEGEMQLQLALRAVRPDPAPQIP